MSTTRPSLVIPPCPLVDMFEFPIRQLSQEFDATHSEIDTERENNNNPHTNEFQHENTNINENENENLYDNCHRPSKVMKIDHPNSTSLTILQSRPSESPKRNESSNNNHSGTATKPTATATLTTIATRQSTPLRPHSTASRSTPIHSPLPPMSEFGSMHLTSTSTPVPTLGLPPPIPTPSAFSLAQNEATPSSASSQGIFSTPIHRKTNSVFSPRNSPPPAMKTANWLSSLSSSVGKSPLMSPRGHSSSTFSATSHPPSHSHHRSASVILTPTGKMKSFASPNATVGITATSSTPLPSTSPPTDRFIQERKKLPTAIALVQADAGMTDEEKKMQDSDVTLLSSSPLLGSPLEQLNRQEAEERFQDELACSLFELASPTVGRANSSHRRRTPRSLSLFYASNSPTPIAPLTTHSTMMSIDMLSNDHHTQLAHTLRSGESAAATSHQRSQLLNNHPRAKRTLHFGDAPSPTRALAERQSYVLPDATKVLDCPGLINDYYLNLLHWSSRGVLAIALGSEIYLWNQETAAIDSLPADSTTNGEVTSVRWTHDGATLSVGYKSGAIKLFDAQTKALHRSYLPHSARVSTMDWGGEYSPTLLASAGLDTHVQMTDIRLPTCDSIVSTYSSHIEEVCGLSFSPDGQSLASGANDNKLCVWSLKSSTSNSYGRPMHLELRHHKAAVKALAWCPWSTHTLASGGGLADGHIRFANTITGEETHSVDTKSQVCSLQWSRTEKELISAHGHPDHTLVVWKFPELTRVASLKGHTSRVLHTSLAPDFSTVVSAGADETLRFWKVWKPIKPMRKETKAEMWIKSAPLHRQIR